MDLSEEVRNKRLNYYNKLLSKSISGGIDASQRRNDHSAQPILLGSLLEKSSMDYFKKPQNLSTTVTEKNDDVLAKIFGGKPPPPNNNSNNQSRKAEKSHLKFNQSLSFDESISSSLGDFQAGFLSSSSSSRRFEEFKRVVESSYEQHVLNKPPDIDPHLSKNNSPSADIQMIATSRKADSAGSSSRIKIPYMSAYNIYNAEARDDDETMSSSRVNINLDITRLASKVATAGSAGSSLNTSPTSVSSAESSKIRIDPPPPTIKPPLTPKPSGGSLAFRSKNILRRSSATAATTTTLSKPVDSLELQKQSTDLETNVNVSLPAISPPPIELPASNVFFKPPPQQPLESSSDSGSDTFDIFSSRESLKNDEDKIENVTGPQKPRMNLSIDLSGLRSDDDEDEKAIKKNREEAEKEEEQDEHDIDDFIISTSKRNSTSSIRQIKPENIPNLALDQFDDDKSQSVTVSLAKSMCQGIDYKKEMEAIVSKDSAAENVVPLLLKSNRLKPLELLEQKKRPSGKPPIASQSVQGGSVKLNLASSIKQETKKIAKLEPISQSFFLRPMSSFRENSARIVVKESVQQQRPNSSSVVLTNSHQLFSKAAPVESSIGPTKSASQLDKAKKNNAASSQVMKRSRNVPIWQSSFGSKTLPARSKSAQVSGGETKPPSDGLFLNYSKLFAIDASFDQEKSGQEVTENIVALVAAEESTAENSTKTVSDIRWLDLPDEIWLKILAYLKHSDLVQIGRTCRKMSQLYTDNSLWREITIKYKYEMRDEWLQWIGQRRPNELNIIQCSGNLTLFAISEMFRNIGEQLTSLNLSRCSNGALSGDNFALQASIRCPNVTNLDLSWTLLSNQTLKLIVDSFKRIENINLSGCNMIQEDGFNSLLIKHGESIKSLEISGCIHFSSNCLINIGVYCRNIERLNISNCHRMTNESLMESCQFWPKLKHIDFRGIKQIKNNCVSLMVRKCPGLESISLGECVSIGDTSILEIATYKPNIKHLDANGCKKLTDNSLRSLASFCGKLQSLNIRATNVTDIGLLTLANGKCASQLEELNLSYLPISENILSKILRNCKKLRRIHLYGCFNIKNFEQIKQLDERINSVEICV